jgi:hypothetical protein
MLIPYYFYLLTLYFVLAKPLALKKNLYTSWLNFIFFNVPHAGAKLSLSVADPPSRETITRCPADAVHNLLQSMVLERAFPFSRLQLFS